MLRALKLLALAVCCTGWVFAGSARADQVAGASVTSDQNIAPAPSPALLSEDDQSSDDQKHNHRNGSNAHDGRDRKERGDSDQHHRQPMMRRGQSTSNDQRGGEDRRGFGFRDRGGGHGNMNFSREGRDGRPFMRGGYDFMRGGSEFMRGRGGQQKMSNRGDREVQHADATPKGPALGIAISNPDAELKSQLGLPDGVGLVVEQVLPNTLAARSGLKQYDVLQKIDDQLVINSDQVGVLIRMHKPGDKMQMTVIRKGKVTVIDVANSKSPHRARPQGNFPPRLWQGDGQRGPRHHKDPPDDRGNREPGPTPDTSGAPAPPPLPQSFHQHGGDQQGSIDQPGLEPSDGTDA